MSDTSLIDVILQDPGPYGAYIIIIISGLYKLIKFILPFIKPLLSKKASVNVTVNNCAPMPAVNLKGDGYTIVSILLQQNRLLSTMYELKATILKEQMEYFEKHLYNVKIAATKIMMDLLKEADIEDIYSTTYFSNFENIMEVCENMLIVKFRRMCKENHFSNYSPMEFREQINKNIIMMEGAMDDLFRKRYPQKAYIKNFNRIASIQPMFRSGLKDCFEYARALAIEKEEKINSEKECFELNIENTIGIKHTVEL